MDIVRDFIRRKAQEQITNDKGKQPVRDPPTAAAQPQTFGAVRPDSMTFDLMSTAIPPSLADYNAAHEDPRVLREAQKLSAATKLVGPLREISPELC